MLSTMVMEVFKHLGSRSPYRGGRELLRLLDEARRYAVQLEEPRCAEALADCYAYATGRTLSTDLEVKYDLYKSSGSMSDLKQIELITSSMGRLASLELNIYLESNPNAAVEDIKSYFDSRGKRALRFVRARRAGYYGAYRTRGDSISWIADVIADRTEVMPLTRGVSDSRVDQLLEYPDASVLLAAAQVQLRLSRLHALRTVIENPNTKEDSLQLLLEDVAWIFGGKFVGQLQRRRLAPATELDIPLLRPDGVLHIVELKLANVPVVKKYRSALVPTSQVNDARAQTENYLRTLDESRTDILETHGVDVRRASGTIVIGHPIFQKSHAEPEINETLRSASTWSGRTDIMTYKQLLDSAHRQLTFSETE